MSEPPEGLPIYRLLTGPDDEGFCRRVSEAMALGYQLHESPGLAFNGARIIAAQAMVWNPHQAATRMILHGKEGARSGASVSLPGGAASASDRRGGVMVHAKIDDLKRIFASRLDSLGHVVERGSEHLGGEDFLSARLAPDMFPLGTQIAFACNQPRGFALWCEGKDVQNLSPEVASLDLAREHILRTRAQVDAITAGDSRLDEVKRIGLGPGKYCELSGDRYVSEFLIPNFYFHISITYAILRMLGVPLGKTDYMGFLLPHVRDEG